MSPRGLMLGGGSFAHRNDFHIMEIASSTHMIKLNYDIIGTPFESILGLLFWALPGDQEIIWHFCSQTGPSLVQPRTSLWDSR